MCEVGAAMRVLRVHVLVAATLLAVGCGGSKVQEPDVSNAGETPVATDAGTGNVSPGGVDPADQPPTYDIPPAACTPMAKRFEPGPTPQSFTDYCAGCHQADGRGKGEIPNLTRFELDRLRAGTRHGFSSKMSIYSRDIVSEGDLSQLIANWRKAAVTLEQTEQCLPALPPDNANWKANGIAAARKPDALGQACVNCHTPDLYDLAVVGYDYGTIARRALLHVDEKDARTLFEYIKNIRAESQLPAQNPADFRPFQQGGAPLQCTDPADCDHAFGLELVRRVPQLKETVSTLPEALALRDAFLAESPRVMPIGIALNRWTEDEFRGDAHARMNEWIPDHSYVPNSEKSREELHAIQDAYLASPSFETLKPLLEKIDTLAEIPERFGATGQMKEILKNKYKSVQVAGHLMRMAKSGQAFAAMPAYFNLLGSSLATANYNPMWAVGDAARVMDNGFAADDLAAFSPEQLKKIGGGATPQSEMSQLRLTWFWVGFMFDYGVLHSGKSNATRSTEYFTGQMYELKYFNHVNYMRFQKAWSQGYTPGLSVRSDGKQSIASASAQIWNYYQAYERGVAHSQRPNDPKNWFMPAIGEQRQLYVDINANLARANALLIIDAAARDGVDDKPATTSSLGWMRKFFEQTVHRVSFAQGEAGLSGQALADFRLLKQLDDVIAAACESRPLKYKEAVFPGHCDYPK
jgi:mono/diheme cytochrome c family protein/cytochrome c551/c552